jgi:hypothetical protein
VLSRIPSMMSVVRQSPQEERRLGKFQRGGLRSCRMSYTRSGIDLRKSICIEERRAMRSFSHNRRFIKRLVDGAYKVDGQMVTLMIRTH